MRNVFIFLVLALTNCLYLPENYDIRMDFNECYHNAYNEVIEGVDCYSNWAIQFTLAVSDLICVKSKNKVETLSPMNILSCVKLENQDFKCDMKDFFMNLDSTNKIIESSIDFFNKKGLETISSNPYSFDTKTLKFPECKEFKSAIDLPKFQMDYKILDETKDFDFEMIKQFIITNGPILAYMNMPKSIYYSYHGGIYVPEKENLDGFKFLRILGWQVIEGKTYWTFSYTLSKKWGIHNYGLIEQRVNSLLFIKLIFNQ